MVQTMDARTMPRDTTGRALAIAVFLLGVILLIAVFVMAYRDLVAASDGTIFQRMFNLPLTLMFKGGLLLIMSIVASAIASKGISLYEATRSREE